MKNLIIIANYNQQNEIEKYLSQILEHFSKENVVVVDDGSTDGSNQIAERMGFHLIQHPKNLGIGAAIRSGLKFAIENKFDGILISSSNGKMVPAQFPGLLEILDQGKYLYIQGSRFMEQGESDSLPLFRKCD